jgi:hypothetical protein
VHNNFDEKKSRVEAEKNATRGKTKKKNKETTKNVKEKFCLSFPFSGK